MEKSLEYLKQFILSHNLGKSDTGILFQHIQNVEEEVLNSYYNYQTAVQEKEKIVGILNKTIEELELKNQQIERQQNREEDSFFKEKLLANVSHELRTPLNAILGMGHLLVNTQLSEKQQEFVNVIKTGADNLSVIINDLLELATLRERKLKISNKPFSTEKLLSDLYNIIWFKARQKQLELHIESDQSLPEYLIGDQNRLHQILTNLLGNAIKFTPRGVIKLKVKVLSLEKNKTYLEIAVKDTGIGIAKHKIKHIFDSFTQAYDNDQKVYDGAGTGLSIVKYLIEMMNGGISVKSKLGQGSEFVIMMPFNIPTEPELEKHLLEKEISTVGGWLGKKIIYIEDNDANILYLKNMLDDQPVDFDVAKDFTVAQKFLDTKQYDCILSDVKLPDGNGIDYIATLRNEPLSLNSRTPVIVITAGATDAERHKARRIGIEGYISKPFSPDILFSELDRIFTDKEELASLLAFYPYKKEKPKTNLQHLHKVMNGNKQGMVEMLDIFLEQLPTSIQKMESAVERRNWKAIHFEAHKVKSTIGIVGLEKLHHLILEINENSRELKKLDMLPMLFQHFKTQAEQDLETLKEERQVLAKGVKNKKASRKYK